MQGRSRAGLVAAAAVFAVLAGVIAPLALIGMAVMSAAASVDGCAVAGTGQRLAGVELDAEQMGNAHTIVAVVAARRLPARAAVIAVATAYQESNLRNLDHGDRDSLGLFQQRPSAGWGTPAQVRDPVYATGAFLDRLVRVPGWQTLPVTVAAQAVQRSAVPGAYAQWEALAGQIVGQLWPAAAATTGGGAQPGSLCPPVATGGGTGNTVAGVTSLPAGLVLTGSAAGQTAVRFALAQLGTPYVWGGVGPAGYDCSGLVMAAWARAGMALPRTTAYQIGAGRPAPTDLSTAVGGDLAFIPGADGSAARPGHVGMVIGWAARPDGPHLYLIQAPMTGLSVEITDVAAWSGRIVAVRHIA